MQFWIYQDRARRLSARLILTYILCVSVFVAFSALAIQLAWLNVEVFESTRYRHFQLIFPPLRFLITPRFFIILTCLILAVALAGLLAPVSSSSSGKSVAEKLGGRRVATGSADPSERRLLNVVEEIAIASSLPVPPVYILDGDDGVNAFAAGADLNDAVIGVTRGALRYLRRDELQAVIGHEFSHILNGDVRLNMRMAQLLFGLMFMAELGRGIAGLFKSGSESSGGNNGGSGGSSSGGGGRRGSSSRSGGNGGGGAIILIILAIIVICLIFGVISKFFGLIVQAAVCRQREYLADASSMQFTRTTALASALKKIGALGQGRGLRQTSSTYSQFFFAPIKKDLFSAHPPLEQRIRRIEPDWDGNYGKAEPVGVIPAEARQAREWKIPIQASGWSFGLLAPPVSAGSAGLEKARSALAQAASEPLGACNLILAMLMDDAEKERKRQLRWEYPSRSAEIKRLRSVLDVLPCRDYLPVIELCAPNLKELSAPQWDNFKTDMLTYIKHDKIFSFREWIIYQTALSLAETPRRKNFKKPGAARITKACGHLLTALVCAAQKPQTARAAFEASKPHFGLDGLKLGDLPDPEILGESLAILRRSSGNIKAAFMSGLEKMVFHDGFVSEEEAMFIRMTALCLEMPLISIKSPA